VPLNTVFTKGHGAEQLIPNYDFPFRNLIELVLCRLKEELACAANKRLVSFAEKAEC
jgi:hypothetical protein